MSICTICTDYSGLPTGPLTITQTLKTLQFVLNSLISVEWYSCTLNNERMEPQTRSREGQAKEFVIWTLYTMEFFCELRITQGYLLDHLLSLRLLKPFCDNVLLEHGGGGHSNKLLLFEFSC